MTGPAQFLSDNAAAVHPQVWGAMRAADEAQPPYDNDALSRSLDARFSALFGRDAYVLWVATGTAANCLALATMCEPAPASVAIVAVSAVSPSASRSSTSRASRPRPGSAPRTTSSDTGSSRNTSSTDPMSAVTTVPHAPRTGEGICDVTVR